MGFSPGWNGAFFVPFPSSFSLEESSLVACDSVFQLNNRTISIGPRNGKEKEKELSPLKNIPFLASRSRVPGRDQR